MGRTWKEAITWRAAGNKDNRRLRLSMQAVAGVKSTPLEQPENPIKTISKEERIAVREQLYASRPKIWYDRQPNKQIIYSVIESLDIRI